MRDLVSKVRVENLQDLEALVVMCQRLGVHTAIVGDVTVQMAIRPPEPPREADDGDDGVHIDPVTGMPFSDEEWALFQRVHGPGAEG